jgi:hypothetical protein
MTDDALVKAVVQAVSQAVIQAIDDLRKRTGNVVVTLDVEQRIFQQIVNPENFSWQPPTQPKQLPVPAEWPKRMVRCGENREVVETRVVNSFPELQALQKTGTWYRWEEE